MTDGVRRHPRPVADAPVANLADGRAIAKAWLIALLDDAPLEHAARLPTADLVAEAPALCAALLRALSSDDALAELPGAARSAGRLAGAGGPAEVVVAAEALRRAARDVLLARAAPGDDALRAALADRLAHVCAVIAAGALAGSTEDAPAAAPRRDASASAVAPGATGLPWIAAIERRLDRYAADGRPFAVLAVEVDDLERLVASESGREVALALESTERALTAALAPADVVVRERLGRYWITTPDADEPAARDLALRVAEAVADASGPAGVGLAVSVGISSCPADGDSVDALMMRADEGLFRARATGSTLS